MKKLLVAFVAAAALALPAAARAGATVTTIPFDTYVAACNGDTIHLSGSLLLVLTETTTPSGGVMMSFHFQPAAIRGVDLQTGTTYLGTGLTRDLAVVSPSGGYTETFVNQFHIQATTGAESFIVSETFHITVLPNGTVRAFVDHFSSTC